MKKSKGLKYDKGKPMLYLLSNYALEEVAKVLMFGLKKYKPWNWANGINYSQLLSAAKRHAADFENGNNLDKESKTHPLANAICNYMFILDYEVRKMKHLDDRRPKKTLKK